MSVPLRGGRSSGGVVAAASRAHARAMLHHASKVGAVEEGSHTVLPPTVYETAAVTPGAKRGIERHDPASPPRRQQPAVPPTFQSVAMSVLNSAAPRIVPSLGAVPNPFAALIAFDKAAHVAVAAAAAAPATASAGAATNPFAALAHIAPNVGATPPITIPEPAAAGTTSVSSLGGGAPTEDKWKAMKEADRVEEEQALAAMRLLTLQIEYEKLRSKAPHEVTRFLVKHLMEAAASGDTHTLSSVLKWGAPVDALSHDMSGDTALHIAIKAGHVPAMRVLAAHGASFQQSDDMYVYPIQTALLRGDEDMVVAMLEVGRMNLTHMARSDLGTPLKIAVRRCSPRVVRALLEVGAPVNGESPLQDTILHDAATWASREVVEMLVYGVPVRGADVRGGDSDASRDAPTPPQRNPAFVHYVEDAHGESPLVRAVRRGHLGIVRLFLEFVTNVSAPNRVSGDTLLITAARGGHAHIAAELIQRGASVTHANKVGVTALHAAAEYGDNLPLLQLLLSHGASTTARTRDGATPLQIAVREGNDQAVQFLSM